jgi:hypothetical protein
LGTKRCGAIAGHLAAGVKLQNQLPQHYPSDVEKEYVMR